MKFEDFRGRVIAYLSTTGKASRKKINADLCPEKGYSTVKNWLWAMCKSGELDRWSDGVSPKSEYLYFIPDVAESACAELVGDSINVGAEKVAKSIAPVINSIPDDIKSEFTVKSDGSTTITLRGAARLLGINHKTLSEHFSGGQNSSKLAKTLTGKGFEVGGFGSQGIPDIAFGFIVTYYAFKAGRYSTPQAEAVHDAFEAIGVRAWIRNELGWKPQTLAKTIDLAVSDNLNALVLSIQGLATSAQSQQAMINDQQLAIREVISGLNYIGQSIQVHGEKIHEHETKIVEFDNYIQQQESLRKDAMRSVLGVKPTVPAPPKDSRAQLIHLVNNYVFAKGLGKEGHSKTWAHLYRDIELRCHCSLEVERKKLEANGMKSPKKIDAIESLGLIDTAVAIACEVLEVA